MKTVFLYLGMNILILAICLTLLMDNTYYAENNYELTSSLTADVTPGNSGAFDHSPLNIAGSRNNSGLNQGGINKTYPVPVENALLFVIIATLTYGVIVKRQMYLKRVKFQGELAPRLEINS